MDTATIQALNPARVRRDDPGASYAAAERVPEFAGGHYAAIRLALQQGPAGVDQLANRIEWMGLSLTQHAIGKRLPEMERRGWVRLTGREVRGFSGRMQREWELVQ